MCGLSVEVVRRPRNSAPPPKKKKKKKKNHKNRPRSIHTAISLHDLRDASLENTSGPSFQLRVQIIPHDANLSTHGPKYLE